MNGIIVFYIFTVVNLIHSQKMGPVGAVTLFTIFSKPEEIQGNDIEINIDLRTLDKHGTKALYLNFTTKIQFDDTITYELVAYKWRDYGWQIEGRHKNYFCKSVSLTVPSLWKKMLAALEPPVLEECNIKPGFYRLDNFQVNLSDFTPIHFYYGQFMSEIKFLAGDQVVLCLNIEIMVQSVN